MFILLVLNLDILLITCSMEIEIFDDTFAKILICIKYVPIIYVQKS